MTQKTRRDVALSNEAILKLFYPFLVQSVLRVCRENRHLPIRGETNSYKFRTVKWRQEGSQSLSILGCIPTSCFRKEIYDLIILTLKGRKNEDVVYPPKCSAVQDVTRMP